MRRLVFCLGLVLSLGLSSITHAQLSVGATPILLDQTVTVPKYDSSYTTRGSTTEISVGIIARGITMRGFFIPTINSSYQWSTPEDIKNNKARLLELASNFTATRLEIGLPIFYADSIIEPFYVSSSTKHNTTLYDNGVSIPETLNNTTSGLGVFYGQRIVARQAVYLKFSATPKDKVFDASYNAIFKSLNFGAGYTYREYENVKLKGPFVSLQLTF